MEIQGYMLLFGVLCYCLYEYFLRSHVEVFFVMNDGQCKCDSRNVKKTCQSQYCRNKLKRKIMTKIKKAQDEILIAMYSFTNHDLVNWILDARKRRVPVRIIVDTSESEKDTNRSHIKTLIDEGA